MLPLAVMLEPDTLGHNANTLKGFAIAIGVVFAMWFVWHWWQVRTKEATAERSARAIGVHAQHLALALNHPELAEPMLGSLSSQAETARYRIFVSALLATADEILTLTPTPAWRDTLTRQLRPHRSYLASSEFRDGALKDCTAETRGLIDRLVAGS
jgi:hypothetical protein